jgi:hypothetical protein
MVDVMAFRHADATAWETAAGIAPLKRPPQRRRNRPASRADLDEPTLGPHHDPARVAREALRRFRGHARAVLEDRLAAMLGVGQDCRVDVDDDLVPLARGAGIDPVVKRGLGQEGQGVGLLLRERGRLRRFL